MYCNNCGKELSEGSTKCEYCGAEIKNALKKAEKFNYGIKAFVCGIGVFALLVITLVIISQLQKKEIENDTAINEKTEVTTELIVEQTESETENEMEEVIIETPPVRHAGTLEDPYDMEDIVELSCVSNFADADGLDIGTSFTLTESVVELQPIVCNGEGLKFVATAKKNNAGNLNFLGTQIRDEKGEVLTECVCSFVTDYKKISDYIILEENDSKEGWTYVYGMPEDSRAKYIGFSYYEYNKDVTDFNEYFASCELKYIWFMIPDEFYK